jgi:hypothetical protein
LHLVRSERSSSVALQVSVGTTRYYCSVQASASELGRLVPVPASLSGTKLLQEWEASPNGRPLAVYRRRSSGGYDVCLSAEASFQPFLTPEQAFNDGVEFRLTTAVLTADGLSLSYEITNHSGTILRDVVASAFLVDCDDLTELRWLEPSANHTVAPGQSVSSTTLAEGLLPCNSGGAGQLRFQTAGVYFLSQELELPAH